MTQARLMEQTRGEFWIVVEKFFLATDTGDRDYWLGRAHGVRFVLAIGDDDSWNVNLTRCPEHCTHNPLQFANSMWKGAFNGGERDDLATQ